MRNRRAGPAHRARRSGEHRADHGHEHEQRPNAAHETTSSVPPCASGPSRRTVALCSSGHSGGGHNSLPARSHLPLIWRRHRCGSAVDRPWMDCGWVGDGWRSSRGQTVDNTWIDARRAVVDLWTKCG
jgi:hypothetical protein